MQVGKGSAMKHYNAPYNSLMHARPTLHCIPLVFWSNVPERYIGYACYCQHRASRSGLQNSQAAHVYPIWSFGRANNMGMHVALTCSSLELSSLYIKLNYYYAIPTVHVIHSMYYNKKHKCFGSFKDGGIFCAKQSKNHFQWQTVVFSCPYVMHSKINCKSASLLASFPGADPSTPGNEATSMLVWGHNS